MKKLKLITSIAALAVGITLAAPAVQPVLAQDLGVTVLRGTPIVRGAVDISEPADQQVTVFRGQPAWAPVGASPGGDGSGIEPVGGFNGWFIDRANNRIGNCFRQNTTEWGQSRIKCVWRRL